MQKMAGTSISSRTCLKMARKYETYLVKGKIGSGMVSNAKSRKVYPPKMFYMERIVFLYLDYAEL